MGSNVGSDLMLHNLDSHLLHDCLMMVPLKYVLKGSDLGSDRCRFLAQHRKTTQVLNNISFLRMFLI